MNSRFLTIALLVIDLSTRLLFAESVPPLINYQGRLTDTAGAALPDGQYRVAFRLWDDPMASSINAPTHLIWGREYDITLIQGAFNVMLGRAGGIEVLGAATNDLSSAFSASNRFLGLTLTRTLAGDIAPAQQREILPRQQLLSAPYALTAQQSQQAQQSAVASALIKDLADALCPPGSIMAFGGNQLPDGWLLCDGSGRSSTVFPRLYAAISTNWGGGYDYQNGSWAKGTNDFNVPDLRGVFLRGRLGTRTNFVSIGQVPDPDSTSRTNAIPGGNTGNKVGSVQLDAFQDHRHKPLHDFVYSQPGGLQGGGIYGGVDGSTDFVKPDAGIRFGSETRSKNAYINYIIKY